MIRRHIEEYIQVEGKDVLVKSLMANFHNSKILIHKKLAWKGWKGSQDFLI
jgi:hypothetical protein